MHTAADRLEIAPSISGSGVIGAGIDGLGNPQDLFIQDEAELKTGNFLLVVYGEIIEVEKTREILEIHKRLGGQNHVDQCF